MKKELIPTDGKVSVNGRAYIKVGSDGSETLVSYGTPIIRRKRNGEMLRLFDGWTATTGRHINYFCGLHKKEFLNLPLSRKTEKPFKPMTYTEATRFAKLAKKK